MDVNLAASYKKNGDHYDCIYPPCDIIPGLIKGFAANLNGKKIKILDAGCGTGRACQDILDAGINAEIYLLEPADGLRKVAEQRFARELESGIVKAISNAALPDLPFNVGQFDVVMMLASGHLIDELTDEDVVKFDKSGQQIRPDTSQAAQVYPRLLKSLQGVRRVLKPNGLLVFQLVFQHQYLGRWYSRYLPPRVVYDYRRTLDSHMAEELFKMAHFTAMRKLVDLNHFWALDEYLRDVDMFESSKCLAIDSTLSRLSTSEMKEFLLKVKTARDAGELESVMDECEKNMKRHGHMTTYLVCP